MQEEIIIDERKIVISDQVYMKLNEEEYQQQVDLLTFILPKQTPTQKFQPMQIQIKCISKPKGIYSFPVGHLNSVINICKRVTGPKFRPLFVDRTIKVPQKIPDPSFTLRETQAKQLQDYVDYPQVGGIQHIGIANAIPGFGKTILQLAIQHKLQLKTLVVTTNVSIRDMWVKEIKKFFGFSPGIVGGGQMNINTPIVVGNIQTVSKYYLELSREFGLLVLDEVHHCPASTFDKVLNHSFAQYKLGLSGTLLRKDGKHVLFKGWFGDNVIIPKEENVVIPTILRTYSNQKFAPTAQSGAWANSVTQLYQDQAYIMEVIQIQTQAFFSGYLPLITSDRVEFSKTLKQMLDEITGKPWALIIQEEENREAVLLDTENGKYQGVIATTSIFSEGISLNPLSCAILTSTSDNESLIRQIIGRVQRIHPGKKDPVVIDLALRGGTGFRHQEQRQKVYRDRKFPLKYFDTLEMLIEGLQNSK